MSPGGRSRKKGCSVNRGSSVSTDFLLRLRTGRPSFASGFANGPRLFGDVNSHRAPRDAASAADAARSSELIDPRRQFVRHPLPVARPRRRAHAASVNVGEIHREARIPSAPPLGVLARQIRHVFHSRAETGRADHRAIGAGQAARGDVVPTRMFVVAVKQPFNVIGVERAAHLRGCPLNNLSDFPQLLPRVRPDVEAEKGVVITPLHPVHPGILFISPALWQIGDRSYLIVDNRSVTQNRTDNAVALFDSTLSI